MYIKKILRHSVGHQTILGRKILRRCPEPEIWKRINKIAKVVKINQKDHAQGHICPDCVKWLKMGPQGPFDPGRRKLKICKEEQKDFYESVKIVMEGAKHFMVRYHDLTCDMAENESDETRKQTMIKVAQNCKNISERPVQTFPHEAVQSTWFLFVILQMESMHLHFHPGRLDRHFRSLL